MSNQDNNIKRILGIYKNKVSLNEDNFVRVELSNKSRLVEPDKNVFTLNSVDKFNEERNQSSCYRISGRLQLISSNIFSTAFANPPSTDDWDMELLDDNFQGKNWIFQISYPFEKDVNTNIVTRVDGVEKSSKPGEGIQIKSTTAINLNGRRDQVLLRTIQKHGIKEIGEFIYLKPYNTLTYLGLHKVVGFEIDNEDHGLILETPYETSVSTGNIRRVFEPSLEDTLFSNPTEVTEISACDANGLGVGFLSHTKIYQNSHDLRLGDYVDLRFDIVDGINGLYKVVKIPNLNEFVIEYQLPNVINTNPIQIDSIVPSVVLQYRVLNGIVSEYYIRRFKVLTKLQDYEVYKAGFSSGIFSDGFNNEIKLLHFNKDIDTSELVDNLGRPLSSLYLTVTKRANPFSSTLLLFEENKTVIPLATYNNNIVLEIMSFWDASGSGTIQKGDSGDTFYGDFVEYNPSFLEENIISETICRFSVPRVINSNLDFDDGVNEGYYYKIHNKIEIRKFSNVIETVENKSNEIYPYYAQINNDGTISWRDLLDIGVFEEGTNGVDYPFVNGCHYLFDNYNIYIRRQLPPRVIENNLQNVDYIKTDPDKLNTKGLGEKC